VNKCRCKIEKIIEGSNVSKMQQVCLTELAVDPKSWRTLYKCKFCGAFWEEQYTGGRWDGYPELIKVSPELVSQNWGPDYLKS
jgi:hypothetical protein